MKTICECISAEIEDLRLTKTTCAEIAKISGLNKTKVWRTLNKIGKIDLATIEALENAELINPFKRYNAEEMSGHENCPGCGDPDVCQLCGGCGHHDCTSTCDCD